MSILTIAGNTLEYVCLWDILPAGTVCANSGKYSRLNEQRNSIQRGSTGAYIRNPDDL